jgi:hypothetical protein
MTLTPTSMAAPSEAPESGAVTKIVQGRPRLWANFTALIGMFCQSVGPGLVIWANPVQFSSVLRDTLRRRGTVVSCDLMRYSRDRGSPHEPREGVPLCAAKCAVSRHWSTRVAWPDLGVY